MRLSCILLIRAFYWWQWWSRRRERYRTTHKARVHNVIRLNSGSKFETHFLHQKLIFYYDHFLKIVCAEHACGVMWKWSAKKGHPAHTSTNLPLFVGVRWKTPNPIAVICGLKPKNAGITFNWTEIRARSRNRRHSQAHTLAPGKCAKRERNPDTRKKRNRI